MSDPISDLQQVITHAKKAFDDSNDYFKKLSKLVAFKTESQLSTSLPVLFDYLNEGVGPLFKELGYAIKIFDNPIDGAGPVMLAERNEGSQFTVVGYGHGDVIHGQEGKWSNDRNPWKLSFEGNKVYGRGTVDNKGQHLAHLIALESLIKTKNKLGFNHRFIIEMGEENGSRGFRKLVQNNVDCFSGDVFFASDGPRTEIQKPNITLGNRGVLNFDLVCNLREGGHHSGNWGGLLSNPAIILANAVSSIIDAKGSLKVEGIMVKKIPKSVKQALRGLKRDGGPNSPTIDLNWGPLGRTSIEKATASNTFEVLSFSAGDPINPVNAVPPFAKAACQIRFVMGTSLKDIIPVLRRHLDQFGFEMVEICEPLQSNSISFEASRTDPNSPFPQWASSIISKVTKRDCGILPNSAGSNMTEVIQYDLGIPIVWLPLSYTGCSQHAPNEHMLKPLMREGITLVASIYLHLGQKNAQLLLKNG